MKFVLLILAIISTPAPTRADELIFPSALTFEPGFAKGPAPGFPLFNGTEIGDPLTFVGRISSVAEPFTDLLPPGGYELTYVFSGSTCVHTGIVEDLICVGSYFGDFEDGDFAIYLDTTPDADFGDLATFSDGELVLLGQPCNTTVADFDPTGCPQRPEEDDWGAFFQFISGSWFERVSHDGVGYSGMSKGELDYLVSSELQALGYTFRADGSVDIYRPLAVTTTTWGAVKALYR